MVCAGSALGLFLARRARLLTIPVLIGLGILLGDRGLKLLPEGPLVSSASELGLVLMLFYTSLFSNPKALREGGRVALPLAAYDLLLNFGLAWWIGAVLGLATTDRLFLAAIMATSSTAIIMKILADEGRIGRREGTVLISLLWIEDWVFIAFYGFLGLRYGAVHPSALPLAAIVGYAAFLLILRIVREWVWRIPAREVLVLVVTGIGLAGSYLGSYAGLPVVGSAFTTGLVLGGPRGALFTQRDAPWLREVASSVFFVTYGALLGTSLVPSLAPLLGLAVAGVIVSEILFVPVLARLLGLTRTESFVTGACLLARGGKSAAAARLYDVGPGTRPGAPPLFALAGLMALVLSPITPLLVKLGLTVAKAAPNAPYRDPTETFSRSARGLLFPSPWRQRSGVRVLDQIVFGEILLLAASLALFTLVVPWPWRIVSAVLALACLVPALLALRRIVRRSPDSPEVSHRARVRREKNPVFDHLPFLVAGPLLVGVLMAVLSPVAAVAYPVLFGCLLMFALVIPLLRPRTPRAPALERALARGHARPGPADE